jgi:hypothetical protein
MQYYLKIAKSFSILVLVLIILVIANNNNNISLPIVIPKEARVGPDDGYLYILTLQGSLYSS